MWAPLKESNKKKKSNNFDVSIFYFILLSFCLFSRAAPAAYEGSQAWGLIGAVATSLHQGHSNTGLELCLRPTTQLTVMLDP